VRRAAERPAQRSERRTISPMMREIVKQPETRARALRAERSHACEFEPFARQQKFKVFV